MKDKFTNMKSDLEELIDAYQEEKQSLKGKS